MATVENSRSSAFRAASRALDHAIEAAVDGSPIHPSGTAFVPADLAASARLSGYRRLGPVSIVDAEGNETRLRQDHTREIALAVTMIALVVWALARRPQSLL
ncbi:MAG: hypothetical protein ACRDL4_06530 [Thermoleophilaceae bacterium]